jgi:hypothetical protein
MARVIYMENERVKARMVQLLFISLLFTWVRAIGIGKGRGQAWPFGRITLTAVFKSLVYICLCHGLAPRVAHVGNWPSKTVGIEI